MRKVVVVSTLFFLTYCSSPQDNCNFDFLQVEKIAKLSLIEPPPPVISFIPVYVIGSNDSISETSFKKLLGVYKAIYTNRYATFSDFLLKALNHRIKVDTHNPKTLLFYSQTFFGDGNVALLYKERGVKGIMDKYCLNYDGSYVLKRRTWGVNEINSISYYFFINQYLRYDDDYNATISFKKLSSILK